MPETNPPPDLAGLSLAEIATLAAEKKLPPVERWNPAHKGDSEMRIASDGSWFHQDARIMRPAMVRLFASILRREPDGTYVLVTPVEKLSIIVEDAPFVAVEMKSEGEGPERHMAFRLNTDELVAADADHPLRIERREDGPHPYLTLRTGIDALVSRSVYYELVELAVDEAANPPGLWSAGAFFPLGEP
jgi:uncharacterized protein